MLIWPYYVSSHFLRIKISLILNIFVQNQNVRSQRKASSFAYETPATYPVFRRKKKEKSEREKYGVHKNIVYKKMDCKEVLPILNLNLKINTFIKLNSAHFLFLTGALHVCLSHCSKGTNLEVHGLGFSPSLSVSLRSESISTQKFSFLAIHKYWSPEFQFQPKQFFFCS